MPNFIAKIWSVDFFLNFKVAEFKHELELGDLGCTLFPWAIIVLFSLEEKKDPTTSLLFLEKIVNPKREAIILL